MIIGSVYVDKNFEFQDGSIKKKIFVIVGICPRYVVVAKRTSKQKGRGTMFGCQPTDRYHNYYLPPTSTYLTGNTWVCLDEFYELSSTKLMAKFLQQDLRQLCQIKVELARGIQLCALESLDISGAHMAVVQASMV